ncbi:hypothetical protein QBC36DRAFT_347967 [Triangularia setosa]|uniref:Uncharacterized protein n=1 Tax=Triangularia setosa TaxID=2587417 RepID=A0AAN7A544_9PEZI|nr:hypothetical protein QBC36DRAFT_347967 [Podospora setosa]
MDEFLFAKHLERPECVTILEETKHLEILKYSVEPCRLISDEDFGNFLTRKGPNAQNQLTFSPNAIPFPKGHAVGPFVWWLLTKAPFTDLQLEFIFRKSDVSWDGNSRAGSTKITSGFVKGTTSVLLEGKIIPKLQGCSALVTHPLLLPFLLLNQEISISHEIQQRDTREQSRKLEIAISQRYQMAAAPNYLDQEEVDLDSISQKLTDCHCQVLRKRPQAWQEAVRRLKEACECYWKNLSDEDRKREGLEQMHNTLASRLEVIMIRLEGLEHYTHVSLDRLALQREMSRLSMELALQQQHLANSSSRESISMKSLALLGVFFLPGTFLSSLFSMPFFDFSSDMDDFVSHHLWIYFAVMAPLTLIIVGSWILFDRASRTVVEEDTVETETMIQALEAKITKRIATRAGARVNTLRAAGV